jgi:8-amino-7-oxononanoate synthase
VADIDALIAPRLRALDAQGRRRALRAHDPALIDVSSNDYLGLSRHPLLIERACAWAREHGAGSRASRLVTGTSAALLALEERLAAFKGAEAALIFATGFQLNSSVLPALFELGEGTPLVFTDRLNHASLHAGCRGLKQIRFRHNDLAHLDALLAEHRAPLRFVVTESVFSMDGDRTDVPALAALAARHGALLYLDEAHATGVLGPQGRGLAALAPGQVPVAMGTLGKALGGAGAYVAGSRALIDWLVNRCAGFIYSTAPAPAALGALDAALDLVPAMDAARQRLALMADRLRAALHARGVATLASSTQIVPAVIGAETAALVAAQRLREAGVLAVAIRPPTVPAGSARLRFSLSAALTDAEFERVLAAVAALP